MTYEVKTGHGLSVLPTVEAGIAQTVVTSPPYFGLRAYGTNPQVWGGKLDCSHRWGDRQRGRDHGIRNGKGSGSTLTGGRNTYDEISDHAHDAGAFCSLCDAWRGELGLEPTPELYVEHLVEVFRAVRRVLRDDGTVFLNLGDSYNAYNGNRGASTSISANVEQAVPDLPGGYGLTVKGLKNKDLIGIPWMVAFALRADGWYLRQEIIWAKGVSFDEEYDGTTMPESVKDRPTTSHETVFLLSKRARYFYDDEAAREPNASAKQREHNQRYAKVYTNHTNGAAANGQPGNVNNVGIHSRPGRDGRNLRSVWMVNPQPFREAHFATFPEKLVEPCILAGSREGDTVLDPFSGAGTTGVVAIKHGRKYLGCELNPAYVEMSERRLAVAEAMAKRARGEWAEIPRPIRRQIETPLFGGTA